MGLTNLGMAILSAGASQANKRTEQYNAARSAQGAADQQSDAFDRAIASLRQELAPFLRGEILPGELQAGETAKEGVREQGADSTKLLQAQLARAGVTGGVGQSSVPGKGLTGIQGDVVGGIADIESRLAGVAADRQTSAMNSLAQLSSQKELSLADVNAQAEQMLSQFRGGQELTAENLMPFLGPQLLVGTLGGVNNLSKGAGFFSGQANGQAVQGGVDVGAVSNQLSNQQFLSALGLDASMFAKADEQMPRQIGDYYMTPRQEEGAFGSKSQVIDREYIPRKLSTKSTQKSKYIEDLQIALSIETNPKERADLQRQLDILTGVAKPTKQKSKKFRILGSR